MSSRQMSTGGYVAIWAGLIGLAVASLLLSLAPLGWAAPFVALGIGLAKAVLIAWFFMHLIEQPSICRWAFLLGIGLAMLLLVMVALDVLTRDAPALRQPGIASLEPKAASARVAR